MISGVIRDILDTGYKLNHTEFSEDQSQIQFEFKQNGLLYDISLNRVEGSLYRGEALVIDKAIVSKLTCRVFTDPEEGIMLIRGTWSDPGHSASAWFAELTYPVEAVA